MLCLQAGTWSLKSKGDEDRVHQGHRRSVCVGGQLPETGVCDDTVTVASVNPPGHPQSSAFARGAAEHAVLPKRPAVELSQAPLLYRPQSTCRSFEHAPAQDRQIVRSQGLVHKGGLDEQMLMRQVRILTTNTQKSGNARLRFGERPQTIMMLHRIRQPSLFAHALTHAPIWKPSLAHWGPGAAIRETDRAVAFVDQDFAIVPCSGRARRCLT